MLEKVGTGCNNTERVSNAWLCISLFLGLEAERAFNMSCPLKSNLPSIFKENPNQKCRLKQQEWEPYPPHCHLCKQVSATASPECQIQLQTAASSASVWISAVQPALLPGWGWCCSFWAASSLSALLVETTLQLILWFREEFNVLLVLMSCVASVSFCTEEGPAFPNVLPPMAWSCVHYHCRCVWVHSSGPWDSWVR